MKARKMQRAAAKLAVLALVAGGAITAMAVSAGADSPNPVGSQTGIGVVNPDGSITVTVTGSWAWGNQPCSSIVNVAVPAPNHGPGWQVSWGDNTANELASTGIFVGTADDNVVDFPATSCTDDGSGGSSGMFSDTLSHTYAAGTSLDDINPCVVTYDVHTPVPATGDHSQVAGGEDNNGDNSVQHNEVPEDGCAPVDVTFPPDVSIVKTGPESATVGTAFNYTLTATNTGAVTAPDVIVTDVLPSNLTYVSATPATGTCSFDSGTATLTCEVGDLAVGASTTVTVSVMATTPGVDIVNEACAAPTDPTPDDNCSTFTIGGASVLAAEVVAQPKFTG
jgi:uncharacterized repeat protein (TIGR01451 family)